MVGGAAHKRVYHPSQFPLGFIIFVLCSIKPHTCLGIQPIFFFPPFQSTAKCIPTEARKTLFMGLTSGPTVGYFLLSCLRHSVCRPHICSIAQLSPSLVAAISLPIGLPLTLFTPPVMQSYGLFHFYQLLFPISTPPLPCT